MELTQELGGGGGQVGGWHFRPQQQQHRQQQQQRFDDRDGGCSSDEEELLLLDDGRRKLLKKPENFLQKLVIKVRTVLLQQLSLHLAVHLLQYSHCNFSYSHCNCLTATKALTLRSQNEHYNMPLIMVTASASLLIHVASMR